MAMGPITPNPPVNVGGGPDVLRPQPTDAPGAGGAGGWVKMEAVTDGGWDVIDDVGDDGSPVWEQT